MDHHFDIDIAKEFGIVEAILINNFQYWIKKNMANETNFHDGRYWTYNTKVALQRLFPYLTYNQVYRAIERLVKNGVLLTGCYNDKPTDRTLWYSLSDKYLPIMQNCTMQNANSHNAKCKDAQSITNNNTNKNTNTIPPLSPQGGKTKEVVDLSFVEESFIPIMEQWLAYKKEKKQKYTPTGLKQCYKKLQEYSKGDPRVAQAVIEQSMANNWAGIFPLKQQSNGNSSSNHRSAIQYGNPLYEGIVREMEREMGPLNF